MLETLTLQCGVFCPISLYTMAFKVPHALATEEAQGPEEAIVDCVTRENAARISCGFQF